MEVKFNLPLSQGGGGTSDYADLTNKPQIGGTELSGNKTPAQLGLQTTIADLADIREGAGAGATALQPSDIVDDLESTASNKPISARAVNEDMVNYVDQSITDTMLYIDQQDASEHAGRVAGDNILDGKISDNAEDIADNADAIEALRKMVNGSGAVAEFDATTRYNAGTYVLHGGYVYRFEVSHEAGPWNDEDVIQTSVFNELMNYIVGDTENIYIQLGSSDGELTLAGLQVQVAFEDGSPTQILTADEDGKCNISVDKGKTITLSVADQTGYQHIPAMTLRTVSNVRYVFFTYEVELTSETCTVTVTLVPSGARPEQESAIVGKTVNLTFSDGSARSAVTDSNRVATFLNVRQGLEGTTQNPKLTGFVTPAKRSFSTNFATVGLTLTYNAVVAAGIFMVNQDGDDVTYAAWDTADTLVAIHVATQALVEAGCDYYVPVEEMISSWTVSAHKKKWSTSQVTFPNVRNWSSATRYYDGQEATQKMISDAATLGVQSPAAEFAVEQTFTLNGNTAQGFIGTRDQTDPLITNKESIYNMLALGGYTASYISRDTMTSSQVSAISFYYYEAAKTKWTELGGKIYAEYYVIPFFTF